MEIKKPGFGDSEPSRSEHEVFFNPAEHGFDSDVEPDFVVRKRRPAVEEDELLGITREQVEFATSDVTPQQKVGPVQVKPEFVAFVQEKKSVEDNLDLILEHPALHNDSGALYLVVEQMKAELHP